MGGIRTIQVVQPGEELICRIPGLFPYIEPDEDGNPRIWPATASPTGSYGKIVADVVIDGVVIPYRTAINRYYQLKSSDATATDQFIGAMDKYIGRVSTPLVQANSTPLYDSDQTDVPEFVYLAIVPALLAEYEQLRYFYNLLQDRTVTSAHSSYARVCCKATEYYRRGGEAFWEYLKGLIETRNTCADELYGRVKGTPVHKVASYSLRVNLYSSIDDLGVVAPASRDWVAGDAIAAGETVFYDNASWLAVEETCGSYNAETEEIEFDTDNLQPNGSHDSYQSALQGLGIDSGTATERANSIFPPSSDTVELTGTTSSRLRSLRRFATYVDATGEAEVPSQGHDWLFYYRENHITNVETQRDQNGNIALLDNTPPVLGVESTNLYAYGDVMSSIVYDEDKGTVTFTYVIGAHLTAVLVDQSTDDDGQVIYKYGPFTIDDDSESEYGQCGVTYTETHQAEFRLSDITSPDKRRAVKFDDYTHQINKYKTLPFKVDGTIVTCDYNGRPGSYVTSMADFQTRVDKTKESLLHGPLIRKDYLIGIAYQPKVEGSVHIERGNAAAFERYCKLGEVKTFDDLESYGNYGFFNLISDT